MKNKLERRYITTILGCFDVTKVKSGFSVSVNWLLSHELAQVLEVSKAVIEFMLQDLFLPVGTKSLQVMYLACEHGSISDAKFIPVCEMRHGCICC